jgi:hypothetical protein
LNLPVQVVVASSVFHHNTATGAGAGILLYSELNAVIFHARHCTFTENYADSGGAIAIALSAAVPVARTNIMFTACNFSNNAVYDAGGAISVISYAGISIELTMMVLACVFYNNSARTGGALRWLVQGPSNTTSVHFAGNLWTLNSAQG